MKLKDYARLSATIRLKSGLHIGTGEKPERGEPLNVMLSKRTGYPYIPGSSLKGKMRHLLEIAFGRVETDPKDKGSPCWCGKCQVCLLFGSGSSGKTYEPTRLIFRDSFLTEASEDLLEKIELEEKPGVRIDRLTGKAAGGALFPMKRVPEGSEFSMEISVRVFENDDIDAIRRWLATGLFFMEQDALGGGGTRGSGYIEFEGVQFNGVAFDADWREKTKKQKDGMADVQVKK
ncbi:MAG: type III-A CRISPR-associated RAMP protein Csm3 [Syntrophorhabdaceae bacterium]|nr:type III-A CRISPR-associated RAMP protein Csm3 [Syntrophorhabdaceae bacterium]MDD5242900.1 type III-A CRISPR-associated RAMP protein Csm3 [Syntrophorhabdaceae bacterium]